jgi:phosphoribosylaminoimidazole-succinocarboxamide synthase
MSRVSSVLTPVVETRLPGLTLMRRGKVRDVYDLGDALLIVATDRISAFDYVLGSGIPDKGKILTQMSAFWFEHLAGVVPNHMICLDPDEFPPAARPYRELLHGRAMLVRKTTPLPIECVARGFLAGSGWKDYASTGRVCDIALPAGLIESDRLPAPIFTPATKADTGHDENISEARAAGLVGADRLREVRTHTLELYRRAAAHAEAKGILIADTKFEFGIDPAGGGTLLLIDEALTPDSSRFWPLDGYRPGGSQPSFDKQYVRDYLEHIRWNKQPPVPSLPADVIERTRAKYLEAYRQLTGRDLS